ncbi:MAG: type II secretion system protein M [Gammaproteobacteria bacterium]
MKDWFNGLEYKERIMVIVASILLTAFLLYTLMISPLVSKYHSLQGTVQTQEETLQWMRGAAAKVQALKQTTSGGQGLGGRSLLSVVDQSARSSGLGGQIKRIEPDGSKGVKIWFEKAEFDKIIIWLGSMTREFQVETNAVNIAPQTPGFVDARITLQDGSA